MADWARWIVVQWAAWSETIWRFLLNLIYIKLPPLLAPVLTFGAMLILSAAGSRIGSRIYPHTEAELSEWGTRWNKRWILIYSIVIAYTSIVLLWGFSSDASFDLFNDEIFYSFIPPVKYFVFSVLVALILTAAWNAWKLPNAFMLRYFLYANVIMLVLLLPLWRGTLGRGPADWKQIMFGSAVSLAVMVSAYHLGVPEKMERRLCWLLAIFATLIALNQLSKFGIDLKAPKIAG